ncbi:glycosyltransferase [Marinobacter sp. OP 3.4]|uniref:glycosyltransferase n=1 Tax=Marinobacter sp. OP 3.4 TaxID=3076501 RepID=UPI002E22ABE6
MGVKISVIVPAHNEEPYITRCLNSLMAQDLPKENYEVIVVDNASTDNTSRHVQEFEDVKYIYKESGPVGAVRNYGALYASGEILAFIDGDCVAPKNWLASGINLLQLHPETVLGGKYSLDSEASWIERYWLLGLKDTTSEKIDLLGGTIFIKKEHFSLVGGFNENVSSGEDSQLASDLRRSGISVKINQALNVIHLGNAKTAQDFIKRQAWHSENYIDRIGESTKDPIFLIIIAFDISVITAISMLITGNLIYFLLCLISATALTTILSIKRISRSKNPLKLSRKLHKILYLDLLYLIGRTIGVARGIKKSLTTNTGAAQKGG